MLMLLIGRHSAAELGDVFRHPVREQGLGAFDGEGARKEKALAAVALERAEAVELDRVFDPFGDCSQSESMGEGDRPANDRLAAAAMSDQGGDEAAVDPQGGDRELEQCGQR
jgi:hypothetical protein